MNFVKNKKFNPERRKYIRMNSVFPVQFRLLSIDGKRFLSEWLQGFTNNVAKGGICLCVNHLNPDIAQAMLSQKEQLLLALEIEMPIFKIPASCTAKIAWIKAVPGKTNTFLLGLSYERIDSRQNAEILLYARIKNAFVPSLLIILGLSLALLLYKDYETKLAKYKNELLIQSFKKVSSEMSLARKQLTNLLVEQKNLRYKYERVKNLLASLEKERQALLKDKDSLAQLSRYIAEISQQKEEFARKLAAVQSNYSQVNQQLSRLDVQKANLRKDKSDILYNWLVRHQNPRTGLLSSFEGDFELKDWAFIYDQSLACQAYLLYGDFKRAAKILDFFTQVAKRIDGRFVNAYYVKDGFPAEFVVHTGPNIWVGLAALHYTAKSADDKYLGLAEEIAQTTLHLLKQDPEGGLRGGPQVPWYSTEHNLDAYAFFSMLEKITKKPIYSEAKEKILNWLLAHAYDKTDIPVLRGKGDSTIATDTYAWSIAALGPEKLMELQMNPDEIIEFAEKTCLVETDFVTPDGSTIRVRGFDFAPQRHVGRGGVISTEWTAQMCVAYQIMADFYQRKGQPDKARIYEEKADFYLVELTKMMITSLSPVGQGQGCLPYATQEAVDTGHGWRTPKGKATGSVAGTAYTLFACLNYNPLELKK